MKYCQISLKKLMIFYVLNLIESKSLIKFKTALYIKFSAMSEMNVHVLIKTILMKIDISGCGSCRPMMFIIRLNIINF